MSPVPPNTCWQEHPRWVRVWAISSQLDPDAAELKHVEQSRSRVGLCETPLKIKEIAMLV